MRITHLTLHQLLCATVLLAINSEPLVAGNLPLQIEEQILERFEQFETAEQQQVVDRIYEAVLAANHPLCNVAQKLEQHARSKFGKPMQWELNRTYDSEKYAPNLKLKIRHWKRGTILWKKTEKSILGAGNATFRGDEWAWDYGLNHLIQPQKPLTPTQQFKRMLDGQWPFPDRLRAIAESQLDTDNDRDQVADYFNHCYRDRKGNVFDELLLYDVWESGYELEISDVEAIAWLRLIKKSTKTNSPIPTAKHDLIYDHISQGFENWREYYSLRSALAARLVDPSGKLPWRYSGLELDLDQAWALIHHDLDQMNQVLNSVSDRASFFSRIDSIKEGIDVPPHKRTGLAGVIRQAAIDGAKEEGLAGLGKRF